MGKVLRSGVSFRPKLSLFSFESFSNLRVSRAMSSGALSYIGTVSVEDGVIRECCGCCRSTVVFIAGTVVDSSTPVRTVVHEGGRARESDFMHMRSENQTIDEQRQHNMKMKRAMTRTAARYTRCSPTALVSSTVLTIRLQGEELSAKNRKTRRAVWSDRRKPNVVVRR